MQWYAGVVRGTRACNRRPLRSGSWAGQPQRRPQSTATAGNHWLEAVNKRFSHLQPVPLGWFKDGRAKGTQFIQDPDACSTCDRIRVAYYIEPRRDSRTALVGSAWFGPGTEGAPGLTHGGSQAAVLDEAMGASVWLNGTPCLTSSFSVRYKRPLALETVCLLDVAITKVDGQKVHVTGALTDEAGVAYSVSEGVFIDISHKKINSIFQGHPAERVFAQKPGK